MTSPPTNSHIDLTEKASATIRAGFSKLSGYDSLKDIWCIFQYVSSSRKCFFCHDSGINFLDHEVG